MKEKYSISGMTCASCANHVHDAVCKIDGINACEVNLLLNQMIVDKSDNLSCEIIIDAVNQAGYGASIYNPLLKTSSKDLKVRKINLIICIICAVLSMLITMYTFDIIEVTKLNVVLHCITLLFLTIVIFVLQRNRLISGIKQLFKLTPTMDSLISIGCISSLFYSLINAYININASLIIKPLYFDSSVMILAFSSIGKYLEDKAKVKTTSSITSLFNLMPSKVILYNNYVEKRVNIEDINVDDLLYIKPGAKIPVDCIVIKGNSYLDKSVLTGESFPIEVNENDTITSGCLNLNGTLVVKALNTFKDSTFSKIVKLVDEAANSKAPISRLADSISKYFVFSVITISLLVFVIWLILAGDLSKAFNYAISVLVVSCPCALGLATPTAIMVASGKAASLGFIYKDGAILENTSKIDTLVFDKTNTITNGYMQIIEEKIINDDDLYYPVLYTLQSSNDHPIAKAFIRYLENKGLSKIDGQLEYLTSLGTSFRIDKDIYLLGNDKLMKQNNVNFTVEDDSGYSIIYYAKNNSILGIYYLGDQLKTDVKNVLEHLNYDKIMLTGDNEAVANKIAQSVGIERCYSSLMPQDKQRIISELKLQKHKVAMIGDGINDSIALNSADIGIAVCNSTDIAVNASDIIILNDNMSTIANIFNLSKFTMRIMKENLLWALGYNCILIPIAAGLFSSLGLTINPMLSSLAMSISSLTVITNALRINGYKPFKGDINDDTNKTTYVLDIDHMMCEHCQKAVENALLDINIISSTTLDDSTCKIISNEELDFDKIKLVISNAGYKVTNIKKIN